MNYTYSDTKILYVYSNLINILYFLYIFYNIKNRTINIVFFTYFLQCLLNLEIYCKI